MNFVECYLPYFRQQLITHPLLALLLFQPLFTESSYGDHLLASPPFITSIPLLRASFQFLVYCSGFFIFWGVFIQSAKGAMLVCPRGGWGNTA
jgi:hypothetical protein